MAYLEICIEYFPFVLEGVGPFTMLRISYSAKNVVWYRCNNIVLVEKGGTNTKSQNFLHLIVGLIKLLSNVPSSYFALITD